MSRREAVENLIQVADAYITDSYFLENVTAQDKQKHLDSIALLGGNALENTFNELLLNLDTVQFETNSIENLRSTLEKFKEGVNSLHLWNFLSRIYFFRVIDDLKKKWHDDSNMFDNEDNNIDIMQKLLISFSSFPEQLKENYIRMFAESKKNLSCLSIQFLLCTQDLSVPLDKKKNVLELMRIILKAHDDCLEIAEKYSFKSCEKIEEALRHLDFSMDIYPGNFADRWCKENKVENNIDDTEEITEESYLSAEIGLNNASCGHEKQQENVDFLTEDFENLNLSAEASSGNTIDKHKKSSSLRTSGIFFLRQDLNQEFVTIRQKKSDKSFSF